MEALKLEAKGREVTGKKVKRLRLEGVIPGVVYGHGVENRSVALDYRTFAKLFAKAGESSLIDLEVNGASPVKVLVQSVQYEPLKGTVTHVDFREVKMTEKLEADIPLKYVGEAPAVKEQGAILVHTMDHIRVRCLPGDLVHEFEIDLTTLKKTDDSIKIRDIAPPKGIELLAEPNQIIVVANAPMSEEELKELEATPTAADVSQVKVATEEKKAERAAAEAEEKE